MFYSKKIKKIIEKVVWFLQNPLGYCGSCQRCFVYPKRRHRNTAYVKDECNWMTLCKDCYQEDWDYYQELWDDHWASRF